MSLRHQIARVPVVGPIALFAFRVLQATRHVVSPIPSLASWLMASREVTNYTWDLDELDERYLVEFLAIVTGQPRGSIAAYAAELHADAALREHVAAITRVGADRFQSDTEARYGRRVGWYALVRALKPRIVVETGIDKGLGSCVLAAALLRNGADGYPGFYYGTEIDPTKGYLLRAPYTSVAKVLLGDSVSSLKQLNGPIDLFINDSDHSSEYEALEYTTIAGKLAPNAVIVGDNAHTNGNLLAFAQATERHFLFFTERPREHWFGGGCGIGVAFRRPGPAAGQ